MPISQSCPSEAMPSEVVQETAVVDPSPPTDPETPNQGEDELTDGAIADETETPLQDNETPGIEHQTETPENELLQQLMSVVEANKELSQQLVKDFDTKLKYDAAKQEQIDKLYNENKEYKQGIHEKLKKSLIIEVIKQIESAKKQISHFENQEFSEANYRKLLKNYNEIATDFQDALEQSFDVVAFNCEENTTFDPQRQKAVPIPTDDATKNKTIRKSLRQGYEITNADGTSTILHLEMVEVYVHQTPQS